MNYFDSLCALCTSMRFIDFVFSDIHPVYTQNTIRWMGPKAPPYKIRNDVPELLDDLMNVFLPSSLSKEQRQSEMDLIRNFVSELNRVSTTSGLPEVSALSSFSFYNMKLPPNSFGSIILIEISQIATWFTMLPHSQLPTPT